MVNEAVFLVSSSSHCHVRFLMNRDDAKALKGPVSNRKSAGRTNCADQYRNLCHRRRDGARAALAPASGVKMLGDDLGLP